MAEMKNEDLLKRIKALLKNVGDPGVCRGCGVSIVWMRHKNGKAVPYTEQGLNHFADCPVAQRFRAQ